MSVSGARLVIGRLHAWPKKPATAIRLQERLRLRVELCPLRRAPRLLAGCDAAFSPDNREAIAGVVVWDARSREVVESAVARVSCDFPYVPGLLSFREIPALLAALRALRGRPDAVLCDGQGLAHPRRVGLACHLGLWLGVPTIGCAKSRLCGTHEEPGPRRGARADLFHRDERVGVVLRTRDGVRPLYVSPGHLCDMESAVRTTLAAAIRYRLPEPTRLAHALVTRARAATIPSRSALVADR